MIKGPVPSAMALRLFRQNVKKQLAATDNTNHRIMEAVSLGDTTLTAPDVQAYMTYRRALRTLLTSGNTAVTTAAAQTDASAALAALIPATPPYPAGT